MHAGGSRFAYFDGSEIALDDAGALPVRSLRDGHRISLAVGGVRPLHPRDVDAIAFPLAVGSGRATVLAVAARAPLDGGCVERLAALADTAAPALQIALDRDDDRRHAEYDGLTGLLRPIAFRTRLAALVERARFVRGARLALVFVDSDRFKEWNDAFGHAAGDALLRALAAVLRSTADGEDDLAARNGGDEFCLVFAGAGKADAIERAEVLRARIAEAGRSACESRGAPALAVTASIGVAAYPADAADANALLECADAAMYHSKRSGRDGVSYRAPRGDGFVRLG
ncbi:MAG: GGDEF domain-containing protein [Candidatus Eremiobacteraeota bacterium]|nr:GGDEF domain-containing protein [Candidatus Eremiobacteraeota bacterium]